MKGLRTVFNLSVMLILCIGSNLLCAIPVAGFSAGTSLDLSFENIVFPYTGQTRTVQATVTISGETNGRSGTVKVYDYNNTEIASIDLPVDDGQGHMVYYKSFQVTLPVGPGSFKYTAKNGQVTGQPLEDSETVYILQVDLAYEDVSEANEENPGGTLPLNSDDFCVITPIYDYPSQNIKKLYLTLTPSEVPQGSVTLSAVSGADKIRIWEDASLSSQVSLPKTWQMATDAIPVLLYIEGVAVSTTREVVLKLSYVKDNTTIEDQVAITVVN